MTEERDKKEPSANNEANSNTPQPDKDGEVRANAEGDKVKVENGKATPTEETVERTLELQQEGQPAKALEEEQQKEERVKRAAEARAARASAKKAETEEPERPKEPSPNQPLLDRIVSTICEFVGPDTVEAAEINEKNSDMPTIVVRGERWLKTAETLKHNPETAMNYLRNLAGVDQETHLEVVYHLQNITTNQELCVKVKTDRDQASIPSVTPIWPTANWNEREVYDLLGIDFPGHSDLRRIMMPDDWVGHPLRKDYEPLDPEV